MNNTSGKLYIVATPIGNMGDITFRAIDILKNADIIACEDTRQTIKLINHYDISCRLVSCHEYSDDKKLDSIISDLVSGKNVALVSDAGTPAVSDPGRFLVRLARENGIDVVGIPGPCAAITAYSVSGLDEKRFVFYGFLSDKPGERKYELSEISSAGMPCVLYVSPHKFIKTVMSVKDICGNDTVITVLREMTKIHEEYFTGNPDEVLSHFSENEPRGEFVMIIQCPEKENEYSDDKLKRMMQSLIDSGMSVKDAAKELSRKTGVARNRLYGLIV